MHFLAKSAALSLMSLALLSRAWPAENHGRSGPDDSNSQISYRHASPRLLDPDEGLAIIGAALEFRHRNHSKPDCSHFVNTIYEQAGFPYDYANSLELYAGTDSFQRVSRPQPGDLIVWRGHVGIVIQPNQHTFFSALRSGLGVEDYQSAYWRKRGRPRFFRYVQVTPPRVLAADTRILTTAAAEKIEVSAEDTPDQAAENEERGELIAETPGNAAPSIPVSTTQAANVINSTKPRREEVRVALLRRFNGVEDSLRGQDLFHSEHPVAIFESIDVKKVHLEGNTGWAEARIKRVSSVEQGQAKVKTYSEKRKFALTRRDVSSWEVIIPIDAVYIPRVVAVRLFAHQLASMTDRPEPGASETEKVQLARLLNVLLQTSAR